MVDITPFKSVYKIWLEIWEQIPDLVSIWNLGLINYFIDIFETTPFWQWLAEKIELGNIIVPFDISLGDLLIHYGLTFIISMFVVITILKIADLIIFFS